jgi:hypothetical protein
MGKLLGVVLVAAVLGTSSTSFSSQLPNELARFTSTNGSVPPQYRKRFDCRIYASHVQKITTEGTSEGNSVSTPVAWTDEVPNPETLTKLVDLAATGEIIRGPGRIGAGIRMYEGVQTFGPGAPVAKLLKSEGAVTARNTSKAVPTLVKFTDFNCNRQ